MSESCEPCDQNPKEEFETSRDQSSIAKMAKDNNDSRKGSEKSKRHGNHNQGGNRKQFRGQASKQSKAVLKLDPAPEPTKTTSVKNPKQEFRNVARESTKSHDAARNPKKEFRNVARESRARRKPTKNKKEFRNVAQARNTNQEFRKVAVIAPAIKDDGKYVEKDNEILRTKNDSKRMLLKIFHDIEVKSEAGDRKRLTSKNNKGKETLRTRIDDVSSLESMQSDDESSLGSHLHDSTQHAVKYSYSSASRGYVY